MSQTSTNVVVANASRTPGPNAPIHPGGKMELWDILVTVEATVTNTGSRLGAAVPQLYLSYPSEAKMPVRSLRGFDKIDISPGTTETVLFELTRRDLSCWDTKVHAWRLPTGDITVQVRFSSRDLPLQSIIGI